MDGTDTLLGEAALRLKRSVQHARNFEAAQVKVIGLDEVRKSAGSRWPLMKDRIRSTSMNFLQGALGEDDIILPCGDGFLIIYSNGGLPRDPGRETQTLQSALNAFYLGDEALREVRATVSAHTLTSKDVVGLIAKSGEEPAESGPRSIHFLPVCNVSRNAIALYFAVPQSFAAQNGTFGYNQSYRDYGRHDECDFLATDLRGLEQAIKCASKAAKGKNPCLVGYSVHSTTMKARSSRKEILGRLRDVPANARKFLVGRISEIELGTPLFSIVEWVGQLRHTTNQIFLEFHHSEPSLEGLDATRAAAAGFYLPLPASVTAESRARCRNLIARWRLGLHRQRMRQFVDGVHDPSVLMTAYNEAVDFVSSEQCWPLLAEPAGIQAVNRPDSTVAFSRSA